MNRALAISIAAFPFVLAFGLYASGTLEDSLLILKERRPRGPLRNTKDNRSSFTSLRRVK
ncbi:MAG TPA: hypothetical protein VLC73_19275 [Burkholderiales bacterium]|nr:hypothetical protein [Burkholderiales bacterium]